MAERWRLRHELKYNDEAIIPLRLEARRYQRYVNESRDALTAYLKGYHPEYRMAEQRLERRFQEIRQLEAELQMLDWEIGSAERVHGEDSDQVAQLIIEREQLADVVQERRDASRAAAAELSLLRRDLALQESEGQELWRIERAMQEAFDEANGALHAALDRHPAVVRFDQLRIHQRSASQAQ